MGKIRVGVIGVGSLGQHHARHFSENERCDLVGVVDSNEAAATKVSRACHTQCLFDYKNLFGLVDAVSIAVPTNVHYQVASQFLDQGVHVLVEKPITNTVQDARALIEQAKAKNLILQVGHIERFNAAIRKVREVINQPRFVECHRLGPFDPRVKDVGVVLDLMIHDLDILLALVDSPIESIDAVGAPILSHREDIANVRMRFTNGCIANLTASRVTPTKKRKIRIFQDDAYMAIDYDRQSLEIFRRVELPQTRDSNQKFEVVRKRLRLKMEDKLQLEVDHFLDCIENNIRPLVDGEAGAMALEAAVRISEQIHERSSGYFQRAVQD